MVNLAQAEMKNPRSPQDDSEISLLDIFLFLKDAYKLVGIMGLLGLIAASIYLLITPPRYEAVAIITMARVPARGHVLGANIEEPLALIARLSLPGVLGDESIGACGFEAVSDASPLMSKSIKLAIPKGLTSAVELKVTLPTAELAKVCAQKVVEAIAQSQKKMVDSLVDSSRVANKARLVTIEERMSQDKALLAKSGQPRGILTPTYFAVLSEIRTLEDEQVNINAELTFSQAQAAQLQPPIDVSNYPVYPKKALSLMIGLMSGLFLGLAFAFAKQMIVRLKNEVGGSL